MEVKIKVINGENVPDYGNRPLNTGYFDIFSRVLLRLFSGPEIPVKHHSLCDK